ncbi:MAG: LLM class flavin-dependent oxidoreductase [Chloroflexi bacterium]|nr:LLM class flavin-dependent oxidoreductase [Chloroflexota bacterium]
MSGQQRRMRFGLFLAPFHRVGENPTLALDRDLELITRADRLGFDEAWVGEHHSFARELIANPLLFIAAAAQRTRRIKIGSGVTSLPYHHPLMVADDIVQLDHMTRGRAMLGVGPGALTSDAYMMGINPLDQRRRMSESLEAIVALLEADAPVSRESDWFTLREARLQMASYSEPYPPIAVATVNTPSGAQLAGRLGLGLLSLTAIEHEAFERTWAWTEEAAGEAGQTVDRANWRVTVPIHIAETREQAIREVEEGFLRRAYGGDGSGESAAGEQNLGTQGASIHEPIERGSVIVGSPEDAITFVERMVDRSGGFGCLLGLAHEWASTENTHKSLELWARYVMPHFQGQLEPIVENRDWIEANLSTVFRRSRGALQKAYSDAGEEMPESIKEKLGLSE